MAKTTFEYNGYHFTPYMKLAANFEEKAMNLNHESALFKNNHNFSYDDFYRASPTKDCDLFYCEENGKIYIPAYNLLEYVGKAKGIDLRNTVFKKPKKSITEQLEQKKGDIAYKQVKQKKSDHEI